MVGCVEMMELQRDSGMCGDSGMCDQYCRHPFLTPFPAHCVAQSAFPLLLGPQSLCLLTHSPCRSITRDVMFLLRVSGSCARSLKEQKNLNSFFAVMFGLSNSAISRLAHTWEVGTQEDPTPFWVVVGWRSLPNFGPSPVSSSQRLPHKVRKLYSALERLLVSAGPFSTSSGPSSAFHGFWCTARA